MLQRASVQIELTRALGERLDGIDVSHSDQGDVLDLPDGYAELLIAEGWALPFGGNAEELRGTFAPLSRAIAADQPRPRTPRKPSK